MDARSCLGIVVGMVTLVVAGLALALALLIGGPRVVPLGNVPAGDIGATAGPDLDHACPVGNSDPSCPEHSVKIAP